jgi:hypothetical protein
LFINIIFKYDELQQPGQQALKPHCQLFVRAALLAGVISVYFALLLLPG